MRHENTALTQVPGTPQGPVLYELPSEVSKRYRREGFFGLGESYIKGLWEVPRLDDYLLELIKTPLPASARAARARILRYALAERMLNPQCGDGAFDIGRFHYDRSNKLFETMLGSSMSYTCAYWKGADNLDQAQNNKLELTCRKLKLKPGMRVLDIGCGWGNFAKYAAQNFGVSVTGVTVSGRQAEFARDFCRGLPVEILLRDYREISGEFDRVVSIEMIEAVGRKNLPRFFDVVHRALRPGGLFVLESISCEVVSRCSHPYIDQYFMWILKYIFPNGYIPKVSELASPGAEPFVIEDWHNFGADYDLTLMAWAENFNCHWQRLHGDFDEEFKRCWNYYLQGCAAFFRARMIQLYQIVYSKGGMPGGYLQER